MSSLWKIVITRAQNGYIIDPPLGDKPLIYTSLDEVFKYLLLHYEGRASTFLRWRFGEVIINRGKGE